ncbi:MAG: ACP phosphodiesterase [Bacteroidia bacterium]
MNFLSHLYLSGNSEGILLGNFIADSVKGSDFSKFSPEIQQGIIIHRKIDAFTDSHPIVEISKERLREKYKKYASVIVDIYYDHYLAKNWQKYSEVALYNYAQNVYQLVSKNESILPEKSAHFAKYMIKYNILYQYSKIEGIKQVLEGMSQRTSFISNMEHATKELELHYSDFEEEFNTFFPEIQSYIATYIKEL